MKKQILTSFILVVGFSFISSINSYCQSTIPGDSLISMLVRDWERAKVYTNTYMTAMPADKYSFKATDSVRSFAQQLLHLTQANFFFINAATGDAKPYTGPDLEKSTSAQTADSVKYYVNSSYDFAISSIKKMSASSLMQVSTDLGRPIKVTRLALLLKGFEHQTHHRGQTTIYLRLAGIHPPPEMLF